MSFFITSISIAELGGETRSVSRNRARMQVRSRTFTQVARLVSSGFCAYLMPAPQRVLNILKNIKWISKGPKSSNSFETYKSCNTYTGSRHCPQPPAPRRGRGEGVPRWAPAPKRQGQDARQDQDLRSMLD